MTLCSTNGSQYSNKSWTKHYAIEAIKFYDRQGTCRSKPSANPHEADLTSNPNGRYGSRYLPDSINNPNGPGNPYSNNKIFLAPPSH